MPLQLPVSIWIGISKVMIRRHGAAVFQSSGAPAVIVNPDLLRAAEPLVIQVDPGRARRELDWKPGKGLEGFLDDMISKLSGTGSIG